MEKVFDWRLLINYLKKIKLFIRNSLVKKENEGAFLNKGQKLWLHAKTIIGGGNSMISKTRSYIHPKTGQHIFQKQVDVIFGI